MPGPSFERWSRAWLWMAAALACHVADEALTDFLSVYNPVARSIRERTGVPLPVFTFEIWLTGLALLCGVVALMAWPASRRARWLIPVSYAFAFLMALNGLGHLGSSIVSGRFMPGAYSSPLLLAASWYLIRTTRALPAAG